MNAYPIPIRSRITPMYSKSTTIEKKNATASFHVVFSAETSKGKTNSYPRKNKTIITITTTKTLVSRLLFPFAIGHPSFSLRLMHNLLRGRLTQTASCLSLPESRSGAPRQSQQRLSFSFLLSKMYGYYSFIALKYVKVGKVNIQEMV